MADRLDRVPSPGVALQVRASLEAVAAVLGNRDLARVEIAWAASVAADWAYVVAVMVLAYRTDGAVAVGGVGVARMALAIVSAPLVSGLAGRFGPLPLLIAIAVARVAAVGLAALLLLAGAPPAVLLVAVAAEAGAFAGVRPTQSALLPALARSPDELVTANLVSSTGEGIGVLVGPALGGLAVAAGSQAASALVVAMLAVGLLALLPVHVSGRRRSRTHAVPLRDTGRLLVHGARLILREAPARTLIAAFAAQTVVRGILIVLIVVLAIGPLAIGESGVGVLNSATGFGGLIGAVLSMALVGRARLAGPVALALALWGAPLAFVGLAPAVPVALAAMLVVGAANAALDVAGYTLLQRITPNEARPAVFGLLEAVVGIGVAAGSIVAPALLGAFGLRGTFVVAGALLPITAAVTWRGMRHADDAAVVPARELALLRSLPMFRPLPLTTLELIAGELVPVQFAAGDLLVEQGASGDVLYLLDAGVVDVERDGRRIRTIEAPSSIGEIALLREVTRTATVRAVADTSGFVLPGPAFVAAVTGNVVSTGVADELVEERLARV